MAYQFRSRFFRKLSFLNIAGQQLVINYIEVLQARHYAEGTLEAIVTSIKRFVLCLPAQRRLLIKKLLTNEGFLYFWDS